MKKFLLFAALFCLTLLAGLSGSAHAQVLGTELPNAGMEDWVDTAGYPQPEGWWDSHNNWGVDNNIVDFALEKSFLNVQDGLFAAELETKIGDVFGLDLFRKYIPGVLTNGSCSLPNEYQLQDELGIEHDVFITGGDAFEGMLDKLTGFYDFTPAAGGDSAYIYMKLWQNDGTVVGEGTLFITGATSDYTAFEVPVDYTVMEEADSLLLIIASSFDPTAANVGSRLFIDNMAFVFTEPNFIGSPGANSGIAIRLFPNPATQSITLENPFRESARVDLYNAMGQLVASHQLLPGLHEVSLDGLAAGTHLYRMTAGDRNAASGTFVIR